MRQLSAAAAFIVVGVVVCAGPARGQAPPQDLQQYVSDLQKSPNDMALREKIILAARGTEPQAAIPEDARRHYVMGKRLLELAKKPADFSDSIEEFTRALLIAPWWAEANRDLGLALEGGGRFDEAIAYIRLYIAANPGEEQARRAQDEIYNIEAAKKVALRESREAQGAREAEARAAAEQARAKAEQARRDSLEGTWCVFFFDKCMPTGNGTMEIRSNGGQWTVAYPNSPRMYTYEIRQGGRRIAFTRMMQGADPELNTDYLDLTLSPDGSELNGTIRSVDIAGNRPHWDTDPIKFVRR